MSIVAKILSKKTTQNTNCLLQCSNTGETAMKIWAKTILGEKITRSLLHEQALIDQYSFDETLCDICHQLDLPTPIVTPTNLRHFFAFNHVKFKPRDFVESVDFDYMELEFVIEKKKK